MNNYERRKEEKRRFLLTLISIRIYANYEQFAANWHKMRDVYEVMKGSRKGKGKKEEEGGRRKKEGREADG